MLIYVSYLYKIAHNKRRAKLNNVQQTKNKFIRDFVGLTKFDKGIILNFFTGKVLNMFRNIEISKPLQKIWI
jgi:hypothetical protein